MHDLMKDSGLLYLTSYDPFIYRRPLFAKLALPKLRIVNYVDTYRRCTGHLGKSLYSMFKAIEKIESLLLETPRYPSGYLASAYLYDFLYHLPISKIKPRMAITTNTLLGSKQITKARSIIVDWMDVWMYPWDEMNLFDIQAIEDADGVVFWSNPLMKLMTKRLKISKCVYVPYGVNLANFDPLRFGDGTSFRQKFNLKNKFLITYSGGIWRLGNLDIQGIDKILKAFQLISNQLKNVILILQLLNIDVQTLKLLKELNIKNKTVIFSKLPFNSSDRLDLFKATDLFVAPTARHPIAYYAERMKFFQYMAAAKPILTEKAPGTESVFGDTVCYVKLDDVDAMADAILMLYNDRNLREKLGKKCRKRVEDSFEWSKLAPIYRNFILSVYK